MKLTRRKLLLGGASAIVLGAAGYKLLRGFADESPEEVSQTLPPALRGTALDVHVHILGTGAGGTSCWMHDDMRDSIQVRAGLWNLGLHIDQPDLDARYADYLLSRMHGAGFLKQVVALAMDYVYSASGERQVDRTPFFTPNDYVARLAAQHRELLFGASIHPYRPDALEELDRVAALGAVLVKWIPNVHGMDLGDVRCRAFYRRLAQHQMALLVHVGDEQAMAIAGQEFGDPRRLVAPLEEGVTVIAAHVASLGSRDGRTNFEHLVEMFPRWPNLFADTSALTLLTRWRVLQRLAEHAEILPRLVHGSDFPLPPASSFYFGRIAIRDWWRAWIRENPFRRDFLLKQACGLPASIYVRGYEVLAPRLRSLAARIPTALA
ncbi:MAG: amidohydrolase [Acidobacteria bacterium]|nr:amidohydrolase [Acidobacteriota bacterium]MCL5289080.1 amidohydrolase [Acidobacteriota bacterium]